MPEITDFDYPYQRFQQAQLAIHAALQQVINKEEPVETQVTFRCTAGLRLCLLLPGHDTLLQKEW